MEYRITDGVFEDYWGKIGEMDFTVPAGVTSIGDNAFFKCDELRKVSIPDSVTSIGEEVFAGCGKLRKLSIPDA